MSYGNPNRHEDNEDLGRDPTVTIEQQILRERNAEIRMLRAQNAELLAALLDIATANRTLIAAYDPDGLYATGASIAFAECASIAAAAIKKNAAP